MKKRLLMLNASDHEIPFILAARKLGFYVVTTSTKAEYVGHKYADEYIYGNYNDYDEMIDLIKRNEITAVSHACTDDCALSAAYIGEKLGWKGHDTFENARIIHRKDYFKAFARKYDIQTPIATSYLTVENAVGDMGKYTFPVIIKPTDLAGGQGIHIARNETEYVDFVKQAFERSKIKHIVIEPYIDGPVCSLNTFIVDRKVRAYCSANDYSFTNKYMTNTGTAPADNWEKHIDQLIQQTEKVAGILGLVDGQLHMQYIPDRNGKPWIIEMMRRNIGNNWSTMLTDSVGVNWPEWVIRAEAGQDCHAIPNSRLSNGYYGYHMMLGDHNGVFRGVRIAEEFKPFIYQYKLWQEPGTKIENFGSQKVGNLMFHFETKEQKDRYIPVINDLVKVMIE